MIDGISIFNCKNSRQSHFFFHFIIVTGIKIAVTDTNSCPHTHSVYQAALKSFTAAYKQSVLVAVIIVPLLIRIKREREIRPPLLQRLILHFLYENGQSLYKSGILISLHTILIVCNIDSCLRSKNHCQAPIDRPSQFII